ncbi:unnamed protein product [Adineta steineri]|uniref:Uncharacterized protein n=1 Tax=Adineta steineri TaxID=433720 RepID=A0A818NIP4_9BILA|nr:unnamed protein product [Adineta steineri]CAF3636202.1 unnamed protein product [Adineta steineri]
MALMPIVKVIDLYRHELFDNGFGIEWMDDNDDEPSKTITEESTNDQDSTNNQNHINSNRSRSVITVRSTANKTTCLPAHIWRSLAKIVPGDVVVELNGVSTAGQTVLEFEKNLKLSGNRIRIRLKSDNSGYTSSTANGSTWYSPPSYINENSTDTKSLTNGHSHHRSSLNNNSMTNGYNTSTKSRSCENSLDTCGRKVSDELAISSSSLIELPTPLIISNTDYDNLPIVNGHDETNGETPVIQQQQQPIARISVQSQSPILSGLDQKTKDEIDARLRDIDDEFELPVTAETVNKSVDLPSARRLAKRLYALDGFKSTDVVRHLCKRNDFNQLVAEEYVKLFDFQGDTLDRALRKFVKQFTIIGEAQDRERVLHFFAARYLDCNPTTFTSIDACHMLTCAIMLLNTDLHDPKITNKMTFQQFSDNLHELNDGKDFSKDLLKSLYNAIKNEQLMNETTLASDDYNDVRLGGHGTLHGYSNIVNPYLEIPDTSKSIEYMQGYLMRKCCVESDGKRTPFLRRGWKAYYASLRDMILYLHKNDQQPTTILIGDTNAIRLHHAFAQEAVDYRKRQHVFRLKTSDWAEYLFQTTDRDLMNQWIDTINLVAASFSSPPLPAAIDSVSLRFQRPLLPSVQTRYSIFEQYDFIIHQINELTKQLNDLRIQSYANNTINGDIKQIKACDMIENKDKIDYLQYELQRYEAYADRLGRHFQQLQIDHSSLKPNITEHQQHHSFIGPIEAFSGVNTPQQPTASASYKKSSQSANITLANANRYSYMMAVNTHPVAIKEHRL